MSLAYPVFNGLSQAYDDFSTKGSTLVGPADSGQVYGEQYVSAGARLQVIGNKLTNTGNAASSLAGYIEIRLKKNVARHGGKFSFAAGASTGNGSAAFPIWKTSMVGAITVPDSPCHFTITPNSWAFGFFNSNILTNVATGNFATALLQNGTVYETTVVLDYDRNLATIYLPDGTTILVNESAVTVDGVAGSGALRISGNAGSFACWEVYQSNAATDDKPAIVALWADDTDTQTGRNAAATHLAFTAALRFLSETSRPAAISYQPGTTDYTLTSGSQNVIDATNLSVSLRAPRSGQILITVDCNVVTNNKLLMGVYDELNAQLALQVVCESAFTGRVRFAAKVSAVAGSLKTYRLTGYPIGTATLKASTGGYFTTIVATPLNS